MRKKLTFVFLVPIHTLLRAVMFNMRDTLFLIINCDRSYDVFDAEFH